MAAPHEKIYDILLDVQKQLGIVSRETGAQTEKLNSIDRKQTELNGYQQTANSKISTAMKEIEELKIRLSDYEEVKTGVKDVVTTKKALAMIISMLVVISGGIWALTKYAFNSYIDKRVDTALLSKEINIYDER
jgi:hypothetical protein